jgi:hypothetical protein
MGGELPDIAVARGHRGLIIYMIMLVIISASTIWLTILHTRSLYGDTIWGGILEVIDPRCLDTLRIVCYGIEHVTNRITAYEDVRRCVIREVYACHTRSDDLCISTCAWYSEIAKRKLSGP